MHYNLLHSEVNPAALLLLKCEAGLSDLAFEKGWRILQHDIEKPENWVNMLLVPILTEAEFFEQYLSDEVMPEDSAEFFGDVITPLYEETESTGPTRWTSVDDEVPDYEFGEPEAVEHTEE